MDISSVIVEMMARIQKLEKEVADLKRENAKNKEFVDGLTSRQGMRYSTLSGSSSGKRDMTRYMFKSEVYLKNRLVYAVVKDYVQEHSGITRRELKEIFYKSLQGSIGVVVDEEIAVQRSDYKVRFFADADEILRLIDGNMFVCSQWGILNIPNFISRARELGYNIKGIVQ